MCPIAANQPRKAGICQLGVVIGVSLGCTGAVALDPGCRPGAAGQGASGALGHQLLVGRWSSSDRRPPWDGEIDSG